MIIAWLKSLFKPFEHKPGRRWFLGGAIALPFAGLFGRFFPSSDPKVILPIIRDAYPKMIAEMLCEVQPMTAPTGTIFAMRSVFEDASFQKKERWKMEARLSKLGLDLK